MAVEFNVWNYNKKKKTTKKYITQVLDTCLWYLIRYKNKFYILLYQHCLTEQIWDASQFKNLHLYLPLLKMDPPYFLPFV